MKLTPNIKLKKPDLTDVADIEVLNSNSDILDTVIKDLQDERFTVEEAKKIFAPKEHNHDDLYLGKLEKAEIAKIADNAKNVQGFEFRNNQGKLEILMNGEWLSVGGRQYTVVRQGVLGNQATFNYSGGPGRVVHIFGRRNGYVRPAVIVDGQQKISDFALTSSGNSEFSYLAFNIEFKNSILIQNENNNSNNWGSLYYLVQTEK